jgi:hypothetical protein
MGGVYFLVGLLVGFFIMGILSADSYNKGYFDGYEMGKSEGGKQ